MGDYAITKVIIKVKEKHQNKLKSFIDQIKEMEMDTDLPKSDYDAFWDLLDVPEFYYSNFPFSSGSYHAYTTTLGDSYVHDGSDFYIDNNYNTRYEDGLWFVEFSSKVKHHRHFIDNVVPVIADGWVGLYGDEYQKVPEKISYNEELICSSNSNTQSIIDSFLDQYNERYIPMTNVSDAW